MPTTKAQLDAMNLYAAMMDEARLRIDSIEYAISGLLKFHPIILREFAYLQLRMTCELIALGCLVAHGDIPGSRSKSLTKAWQADDILHGLQRLHSDFYPHPVNPVRHPTHVQLDPIKSGFLTKGELLTLNAKAGDIVHRGNLRKMLAGPIDAMPSLPDAQDWLRKVKTLLKVHRIALFGGEAHFICHMSAAVAGGRAQVAHVEVALPDEQFPSPSDPEPST